MKIKRNLENGCGKHVTVEYNAKKVQDRSQKIYIPRMR